jgi:asparagine synthase (glutamine-hydrolysing)
MVFRRARRKLATRIARMRLPAIARQVLDEKLTYLALDRMRSLTGEMARIDREQVPGDLIEFGVALGGSSIVLASLRGNRRFSGYDVFARIPEPGANDGDDAHARFKVIASGQSQGLGGDAYYGYQDNLYDRVKASFAKFGMTVDQQAISLHKGLFEETFAPAPDARFALIHIDCDWHDPVHFCLTRAAPLLSKGGVILVDDYNDYEGCRVAVDTVLAADRSLALERTRPHAVIRKIA